MLSSIKQTMQIYKGFFFSWITKYFNFKVDSTSVYFSCFKLISNVNEIKRCQISLVLSIFVQIPTD